MATYRVMSNIDGATVLSEESDHWILRYPGIVESGNVVAQEKLDEMVIRETTMDEAAIVYMTSEYALIRLEKP